MTSYALTLAFLVLLVVVFRFNPAYGVGVLFLLGFIAAYPAFATVALLVAFGYWLAVPQKRRRR